MDITAMYNAVFRETDLLVSVADLVSVGAGRID
jgi:hypothetical protein